MPHSPRMHGGKLWLLNSGTGDFGWVENGQFNPLTFCPGYARGLTFAGPYAVIGISRARENRTFAGLALDDALRAHDVDARTGLLVIDTRTGAIVEWVRIEGYIGGMPRLPTPKPHGCVTPRTRCSPTSIPNAGLIS